MKRMPRLSILLGPTWPCVMMAMLSVMMCLCAVHPAHAEQLPKATAVGPDDDPTNTTNAATDHLGPFCTFGRAAPNPDLSYDDFDAECYRDRYLTIQKCKDMMKNAQIPGPPKDSRRLMQVGATLNAVFTKISQMFAGTGGQPGWQVIFNKIVGPTTGFRNALNSAVLLYLVIFGVMVLFNLVNVTWYEAFIRLLKIGVVYYLISGGVGEVLAKFFVGGMNDLIEAYFKATIGNNSITQVLTPVDPSLLTNAPLNYLIVPLQLIMDIRFIMVMLSLMFAGLSGFVLMLFLIQGTFYFMLAVLGALATYVKALIGLFVLFAISPIFVACLLFDQTRRLFDGWFNLCLNFALQPIFVFAFLGFFMMMIAGVLAPILTIPVCYGPFWQVGTEVYWWFFPVAKGSMANANDVLGYALNKGSTPDPGKTDLWERAKLHLHLVDVLMFVLLSSLSWRYSSYVEQIARELSGGGVSITTSGADLASMAARNGVDPMGLAQRAAGSVSNAGGAMMKMVTGAAAEGGSQTDAIKNASRQVGEGTVGNRSSGPMEDAAKNLGGSVGESLKGTETDQ